MAGTMLRRSLLLAILWWVLTEGRPDTWGLGLVGVAAALASSLILLPRRRRLALARVPGFLGYFLWHSAKAGAQVAAIALRFRLDLRPAVLELPLALPGGMPRILMAAVLGLMPGSISVRLADGRLRVHALDERLPVAAAAHALEARIARLFREVP